MWVMKGNKRVELTEAEAVTTDRVRLARGTQVQSIQGFGGLTIIGQLRKPEDERTALSNLVVHSPGKFSRMQVRGALRVITWALLVS